MADEHGRGSSKLQEALFGNKASSHEDLLKAVAAAREDFTVRRWWKYGQPAIDLIKATLDVKLDRAGQVVQELVRGHGAEVQVGLDVFPYGIPHPDGVRIDVTFERKVG